MQAKRGCQNGPYPARCGEHKRGRLGRWLVGLLAAFGLGAASWAQTAPAGSAAASVAAPSFPERLAAPELLAELRRGGFALYLRHSPTDNSRPDRVPQVDLNDCSTQRVLSAEGRAQAQMLGQYIRRSGIPFDTPYLSPMCRVKDTVQAIFPNQPVHLEKALQYTANLTPEEKRPIVERTRELLSAPPPPGLNSLVVAHGPNLMDVMGYFPKEGTLVVLKPLGAGRFDYVASVPFGHWPQFLGEAKR